MIRGDHGADHQTAIYFLINQYNFVPQFVLGQKFVNF